MKQDNNFDNWLRSGMDDYKPLPPVASRDKFLAAVSSGASSGKGLFWMKRGLILLFLVSVTSLFLFDFPVQTGVKYYPPLMAENSDRVYTQPIDAVTDVKVNQIASSVEVVPDKVNQMAAAAETIHDNDKISKLEDSEVSVNKSSNKLDSYSKVADDNQHNILPNDAESMDDPSASLNNEMNATSKDSSVLTVNPAAVIIPDKAVETHDSTSIGSSEKKGSKAKQSLPNTFIYIYYRPELLWNIIENDKLVHNLGLEWQTRLFDGRYVMGTGLGLSLTKGYYEYAIDYNEYLGSYNRLDSVSFRWVPETFNMEYEVFTTEESVYDTSIKTSYSRIDRKFAYLQIPVTLGYDFINNGRTTLGIRFIPVLSLLLSKKPVDFRYDAGQNRVIQINKITADRVRSNWQLSAGICYGRALTRTMVLEIEPRLGYYFNSVLEKSDNSVSPMGASIRVALGFRY